MTKSSGKHSSADTVLWTLTILSLSAMLYLMALNGMIDLGAAAHDAFCAEHGWAV